MEMCRVCLSTDNYRFPMDESFITNYNLLTNLNITLLDGMPQYSCQTCIDTVKYFMEFREKSITAETTLREIICSNIKSDNKTPEREIDNSVAIKSEIKEESYDLTLEPYDVSFEDFDEDLKDLIVTKQEDTKPERVKKKNKKLKLKTKKKEHKSGNSILDELKWFCGICPKTFDDKIDLNKHLDVHKNSRQCYVCWEKVNSLSQLLAHRLAHVSVKQYKCHICEKRYRSSLYLEYHYRNIHIEEDDTRLTCNQCLMKYNSPRKLSSHIGQVHSYVKYICDICSKGFRNKSNLKSHIKFHNENKAYVCDQCGFSCKHSGGLNDHKLRKHTPKRVCCKNCKRPFLNQEHHDKHKCKEKVTVCPICGQQLKGNVRLSKHMMKHSNILSYECNRCPAKYKTKPALTAHLDRHDGNRTKQCEYCPAKFYTTTVLIKHRRTHTGEKPYVCKICHKGFTGNYNLKVHMKVHGEYLINKKNGDSEDSQTPKKE